VPLGVAELDVDEIVPDATPDEVTTPAKLRDLDELTLLEAYELSA
jgi:hypothetical protein